MTVFVDKLPDPQTRSREKANRRFAAHLRANPGRWAVYPWPTQHPHSTKHRIRHGLAVAFGPGFESEVRQGIVHVRYNPNLGATGQPVIRHRNPIQKSVQA